MLKQDSVGLTSSRIIYFLVLLTFVLAVSILKYFLKWLDVFSDHKASNPCIHSTTTLWSNGCSSEEGQGFIGISNVTRDLVFVFNVGPVLYVVSMFHMFCHALFVCFVEFHIIQIIFFSLMLLYGDCWTLGTLKYDIPNS